MAWKNVLYAVLAVLLPLVYEFVVDAVPSFPLDATNFIGVVLWIIGLLIGGWQVTVSGYRRAGRLLAPRTAGLSVRAAESFALPYAVKNILYALLSVLVPLLYTTIIKWQPSIPITGEAFFELVLWLIGLVIGGWQVSKAVYIGQARLLDRTRTVRL
ncbi:MAG: hypothetical protein GX421_12435 [Caldisericales bacterium]|nr:hypothetical protein [Caldisericales bacterium]